MAGGTPFTVLTAGRHAPRGPHGNGEGRTPDPPGPGVELHIRVHCAPAVVFATLQFRDSLTRQCLACSGVSSLTLSVRAETPNVAVYEILWHDHFLARYGVSSLTLAVRAETP